MTEGGTDSMRPVGASASAPVHCFGREAMGTVFEVRIASEEAGYAEQAATEALEEAGRLEAELSRFIESSDVSRINDGAHAGPVRVGIAAWECLKLAEQLHAETMGAFDVTVLPALEFHRAIETGQISEDEREAGLAEVSSLTSMYLLNLNEQDHTVEPMAEGVKIDLGGIGKGYAVDELVRLLREWDIASAVVHSGWSTAYAIGAPPGAEAWRLGLRAGGQAEGECGSVELRDRALAGSGTTVKGAHIIDPRTCFPSRVEGRLGAWAAAPSAAEADALSTAFWVMSDDEVEQYCLRHPDAGAVIARLRGDAPELLRLGTLQQI